MEWTDRLATGISTIDSQHKELFKRINNLVTAIRERRCKSEIDDTIKFLDDYARVHFSEEEKHMRETEYPGLDRQHEDHRQYLAALIPTGDVIVLNTLRYKNELISVKGLDVPSRNLKASGVSPREAEMAKKLVEEMTEPWKPEQYRDTYHEDLMKLIDKRIKAGKTEVITEAEADEDEEKPARGEVIDLMALLKRSVQAKGQSPSRSHRVSSKQEQHPRRKSA